MLDRVPGCFSFAVVAVNLGLSCTDVDALGLHLHLHPSHSQCSVVLSVLTVLFLQHLHAQRMLVERYGHFMFPPYCKSKGNMRNVIFEKSRSPQLLQKSEMTMLQPFFQGGQGGVHGLLPFCRCLLPLMQKLNAVPLQRTANDPL